MITVFTPTYNRGYCLKNLYESLCRQTILDFEWIVIDDGSTDSTFEMLLNWQKEAPFSIIVEKQINGGKHRAINKGVKLSNGELFFIVDSDDYIVDNAIEVIVDVVNKLPKDELYAGVCGLKCFPNGQRVGGDNDWRVLNCTSLDFRYKYKIKGDMAEVFYTHILKEFPFPEINGEKFCPEALVINRIACKYKIHFFYKCLYICDYLSDGLTAKITKIRMNSPISSMICYSELCSYEIPLIQKIKAVINFWRFSFCSEKRSVSQHMKNIGFWGIFFLPFGLIMYVIDKKKYDS